MRSISHLARGSAAACLASLAIATILTGCGVAAMSPTAAPIVEIHGSRAHEYTSLDQVAEFASAIVVVTPTGETRDEALPEAQGGTKDSAPTTLLTVTVDSVLSGSIKGNTIEVASPGLDARTGKEALAKGRQYILFVTPAMYAANQPVGGYAVVGGPAGMYAQVGSSFAKVDAGNARLPSDLKLEGMVWPEVTYSEDELLAMGPR